MSTIRQLHPGDEAALERFLLAHLDSSMFLLSNMRNAGLVDNGEPYSGVYVAALEGNEPNNEEIVAVLAHYWNGNIICQAPVEIDALWRSAVALSGRPVAGIVGLAEQVNSIADALGIMPEHCLLEGEETLFTLDLADLILPPALQTGSVSSRRMTVDDLDQLSAWRAAYQQETLGAPNSPQTLADARSAMLRSLNAGTSWVLEARGQLLAMTSFNAALSEAVQVGGVYTPPELRGRGYARAVVAASLRDASNEGVQRAILFTGTDHVAAQKAYRALGFEAVAAWGLVLLKEPLITLP